jgi:hypothetical protein
VRADRNGAGRTVRSGLRCLLSRSWPDRSALASAMGKLGLHITGSAVTGVRGFEGSASVHLGGFASVASAVGGLGDPRTRIGGRGRLGDGRRDETFKADRNRHRGPPRATRVKPGMKSGGPPGRTAKGLHPATGRFHSAGRPGRPSKGLPVSLEGEPPPPSGTGSRSERSSLRVSHLKFNPPNPVGPVDSDSNSGDGNLESSCGSRKEHP